MSLPNGKKKPWKQAHKHTHTVKNTLCGRIYSLYFSVLLFHADENGHFIISVMIKALRSM